MKKPSRRRKPKRSRPEHDRQGKQRLNKAVRESYPAEGGSSGDSAVPSWSESLEDSLESPIQNRRSQGPKQGHGKSPSSASDGVPGDDVPGVDVPGVDVPGDGSDSATKRWGVVVGLASGLCEVEDSGQILSCTLPSRLARAQKEAITIGDEVLISCQGETCRVREILPRRTVLSRPDPHNPRRERVIAANMDVAVLVVSLDDPPLRPALVDRYLIAIERSGAEAILCVNKIDLIKDPDELAEELESLETYRSLVRALLLCSTKTGHGIDELRQQLKNQTAVFVGHSGVGKSSLVNALAPDLNVRTGAVSQSSGTGRHTTTRSNLFDLGLGIRLIDTPGVREFGLWRLTPQELLSYFPDFDAAATRCHFSDCTHTHEPHCGVRVAVIEGKISGARFETYQRILVSLTEEANTHRDFT
jgi:ribosome biogenesis GTPase